MSAAAFLTAALESALDNEVATPDDVLRHTTPDVLAAHLPRSVWARLISACLAAPRVDARLIVETIGVATLGQHVPPTILWACLSEIGLRALGRGLVAAPPSVVVAGPPLTPPPPVAPAAPVAARVATPPRGTALDSAGRPSNGAGPPVAAAAAAAVPVVVPAVDPTAEVTRVATPPIEISKLAAEKSESRGEVTRVATPPREPEPLGEPPAPLAKAPRATPPSSPRRATTATDFEIETDVNEQWKRAAATPPPVEVVDEDQLIDWSTSEETATTGDKYTTDRKPR